MAFIESRKLALIGVACLALMVGAGIIWSSSIHTTGEKLRPFRLGLVEKITTINPAEVSNHSEKLAASAMYEPLVRYDRKTQSLKPGLARNWGYSADGKSLVFLLAGDVVFHNGKRLKAQDVKQSWERSLKLAQDWEVFCLFETIDGARAFSTGQASEISGLKVVNNNTLRVFFAEPDSSFVYKVTHPSFWVVDVEDPVNIPPGTGPFKLVEFTPGQKLVVESHNRYHGLTPHLSRLNFQCCKDEYEALTCYKRGELDYLDSVPVKEVPAMASHPEYKDRLIRVPLFGFYALGMNVNHSPFNEVELRRGINYGIDRDILVNSVMGGLGRPLKGILPVGLQGYNRSLRGYTLNPEMADELLGGTSYLTLAHPPDLKLKYNDDSGHARMANALKIQMEAMGIKMQSVPLPWTSYIHKLSNMDMDFFRLGWDADYPDPDSFLYPLFHSSRIGISNFTGYRNASVDRILDAARQETKSNVERIKLLRRAEQIIIDDAPMVWIFQKEGIKLIGPEVEGLSIDGMEMIDWVNLDLKRPKV